MKKLFTNDKFFWAVMLISVIGSLFYSVVKLYYSADNASFSIPKAVRSLCTIAMFISYKKHSKNVMKGMMGALLMAHLLMSFSYVTSATSTVNTVCALIYSAAVLLIFINHFIINSEHYAMPKNIAINEIMVFFLAILGIIWNGSYISYCVGALDVAAQIVGMFTIPSFMATIVCIESRLDAYRLDREKAGWTEEEGYPKGYVRHK